MNNPQSLLLRPLRPLLTRRARHLYLRLLLLLITTSLLLLLSTILYPLFYHVYIPPLTRTLPLPLTHTPSSITAHLPLALPPQKHSYTVTFRLPRTPQNLATGNFHVTIQLIGPGQRAVLKTAALVPYSSPLLRTMKTLAAAPMLVLGVWREEEVVVVGLGEAEGFVEAVRVGVDKGLDCYEGVLRVEARLEGVRWWVWRWRWAVGLLGVAVFWGVSLGAAGLAWWGVGGLIAAWSEKAGQVEMERGMEGTEEWEESSEGTAMADDEDTELEVELRDSGLGTMSESTGTGRARVLEAIRRRR